eukprot:2266183-Prymnesium_polylepis.1
MTCAGTGWVAARVCRCVAGWRRQRETAPRPGSEVTSSRSSGAPCERHRRGTPCGNASDGRPAGSRSMRASGCAVALCTLCGLCAHAVCPDAYGRFGVA